MALRPLVKNIKSIGTKSKISATGGESGLSPFYFAAFVVLIGVYLYANWPRTDARNPE